MNVVESRITDSGKAILTIRTEEEKTEQKEFSSLRCGLCLPRVEVDGFYIVLGEEFRGGTRFEGQPVERGKILYLTQHQSSSMFFPHIVDSLIADSSRYGFRNVYLDYDPEKKRKVDEVNFLSDLVYERTSRHSLSFSTAPYWEDFAFGISLINSNLERGLLALSGKSLALQQLRELKRKELAPGEGESKYNALNALRFVIGAFEAFKPRGSIWTPPRRPKKLYNVARPRF